MSKFYQKAPPGTTKSGFHSFSVCHHFLLALPRMMAHYDGMKSKHHRLLTKIFATPTSGTLVWSEIEALLVSLGCEVEEKAGSAIKIFHGDDLLFLHRPHPRKEAKKYQVREVAAFLTKIGVTP